MIDAHKALIVYGGVTTAALAWLMIGAAAPPVTRFGEIDVQRINVREPDGTLRMTISSAGAAPGAIVKGREYRHPSRQAAGLLFFNDEGTENGGLIFGGKAVGGKKESYGSLTFDRYEQDQVVQVTGSEDGDARSAGLVVSDRPERPMDFAALSRVDEVPESRRGAAYAAANAGGVGRVFVGRSEDKASQVALRDGAGRKRLVLRVTEQGAATIDFLDATGRIVRTVTPTP